MSNAIKRSSSAGPISTISSSSEFQILEHPATDNGDGQPIVDFSQLCFDLDEMTGSLTLEEAVNRVKDLMNENQQLKEIILENNVAIREFHNVLLLTQTKYQETQSELKLRNEQSRNIVNRLAQTLKAKDTKVNELAAQIKTMSEDGSFVSEHVAEELQSTIDRLREENQRLKVEHQHQTQQPLQTAPDKSPADKSPTDVHSLQDELKTVNSCVRELKERSAQLEQENENLRMTQEQDAAELEKNRQYTEQMVEEVNAKEEENRQQAERVKHLEEREKECLEQLDGLREELDQKTEVNKKILAEKADLLAQNMHLHTELAEYRSQSITGLPPLMCPGGDDSVDALGALRPTIEGASHGAMSYEVVESAEGRDSTRVQVGQSIDRRLNVERHTGAPSNVSDTQVKDDVIIVQTPGGAAADSDDRKLQEAQSTIDELQREISQLKKELESSRGKHEELKATYNSQVQQLKDGHERELVMLKDQVDKSSKDSKQDAQNLVAMVNEVHTERRKAEEATHELARVQQRLKEVTAELTSLQQDTEERRTQDDRIIDDMTVAIGNVNTQLQQSKQEIYHKFQENQALRQSLDQVYRDYTNLLNTFEQYKQECDQKSTERVTAAQYKEVLEKMDGLTAQLVAASESIDMKTEEIDRLKTCVRQLKTENEAVPLLNAQAEIYRNDFQAEREARQREHAERLKLQQDTNQLQIQVQNLQEELEINSRQQMVEMQRRHGAYNYGGQAYPPRVRPVTPPQHVNMYSVPQIEGDPSFGQQYTPGSPYMSGSGVGSRSSEEEEKFPCPKCMIELPDFDTLNMHVLECLDN